MDSPTTPTWGRLLQPLVVLLVWVCLPVPAVYAAGGDASEARAYFDKASASFALGRYPAAADNFEKAFELKPDPALLYNAAQAHRLAGNKERALTLYQNYLRLYSKAVKRSEVETRVEELKKAIERDRQLATSPPTTTMPSPLPRGPAASDPPSPVMVAPAPVASSTPASSAAVATTSRPAPLPSAVDAKSPTPVLVAQPEPANTEKRSLLQKPLFWTAVGGAVAVAVVVVLIVALGGPKDPSASLGIVK